MITHNQAVFAIRALLPQITESDHGTKYWVGMPVQGDTQLDDAFIVLWDFDDIEQPTPEEIAAKWADTDVQAAYAEFIKPPPKKQFSVREFRDRFTMPEQIAIRSASMSDMEVGLVYDDFQSAQFIDINDPAVAAGIDLYTGKGLLAPNRKAELLTPQAAE